MNSTLPTQPVFEQTALQKDMEYDQTNSHNDPQGMPLSENNMKLNKFA